MSIQRWAPEVYINMIRDPKPGVTEYVTYADHVAAVAEAQAEMALGLEWWNQRVNDAQAEGYAAALDAAWNAVAAHDCDPESTTHCNCQLAGMDAIDALRGES